MRKGTPIQLQGGWMCIPCKAKAAVKRAFTGVSQDNCCTSSGVPQVMRVFHTSMIGGALNKPVMYTKSFINRSALCIYKSLIKMLWISKQLVSLDMKVILRILCKFLFANKFQVSKAANPRYIKLCILLVNYLQCYMVVFLVYIFSIS